MRLTDLLTAHETSQADLGRLLNVSHKAVHQWLRRGVPAEWLAPIVNALELSAEEARLFYAGEGLPLPEALSHAPALSSAGQSVDSVSHSA